ncbi:glycosyl transferase [Photobacterium aquimaris]|uniref:Glycosyltransferase family 1 protein n=1 Tax=Photobacterium aquimaris TaxID=512643 RepID=A0A2T3ITC8_9GAMM|nr:glycosyltransferase [Photobacterium aquimaris]OBU18372.1 glycosyl transferase [Photobacterium aquimaris]OBU20795.1 glycosyl transferase [Photobacterium aquimaris]PSU31616.1 glycosyltransferase family 1 protein [Photobacterium aquimaris]PSW03300.1 glycosyltransferase family 1 protein [Photobacterium aquimaris]
MAHDNHIFVFDSICYTGGSKFASREILKLINLQRNRLTILTTDPQSWPISQATIISLPHPSWLSISEVGYGYWLRQLFFCWWILYVRCRYGSIQVAVGASAPGNDMPIYLLKWLLRYKITQLIHGNIGVSLSCGLCLYQADNIFYLHSTYPSIVAVIQHRWRKLKPNIRDQKCQQLLSSNHFLPFINGIAKDQYPSQCQYHTPTLFWAASLLKWKGLDLLLEVIKETSVNQRIPTNICYLVPQNTTLSVTVAPQEIESINWYQQPDSIDSIRANSNIFISTSDKEPFGLSILEALFAGMCVIIPEDGAFWDTQLTHKKNCLKYTPHDPQSLQQQIDYINHFPHQLAQLGAEAALLSQDYQAEQCYSDIISTLCQHVSRAT